MVMVNVVALSYMMVIYLILSGFSMMLVYVDLKIICEWKVISLNSLNMEFILLIDWISMLFISFILLISSMIMMYSMIYMESEQNLNRFNGLMILFILSMVMMVLSPNMISILLGWDGLGLVSYCLVMYYQNFSSYNSAMVTVLCNRLGDVGILMSISLVMVSGSWNLEMNKQMHILVVVMLLLAGITKSAQIPFSVWLPLAMAAPTPVSALVHSSTLVTAGVYLMIRFHSVLINSGISMGLLILSVMTMFMAGLMANFENDFKKIIALSTLSQLGFMMMILSVGFKLVALNHLLMHAIFKSMLFMGAGVIIHSMKDTQDIRLLGGLNEIMPFTLMSIMVSNMALMGVPFMSGFYSKDWIMELVYSDSGGNIFLLVMVLMSLFFTVSYSIRMVYYLMFNLGVKFYSYYYFKESAMMNFSMIILLIFSVGLGSMMGWLVFFDSYGVYLGVSVKLVTLELCVFGIGVAIMMIFLGKWLWGAFKIYYLMYFFSSMWFLVMIYGQIYSPFNVAGLYVSEMDKSWVEALVSKYYLINFMISKFKSLNYKYYMFLNMILVMMLCLYLMF